MSFFSDVAFLEYHMVYLNKPYSLCDLYDTLQLPSVFTIPEKAITVNLQNITFGPNQRVIAMPTKEYLKPRLFYYCLLYYIFETNAGQHFTETYEQLLSFILSHDMSISNSTINITDQEAKTYLIQFFYSLYRDRCKNKLIVEQLEAIPQIDLLMRSIIDKLAPSSEKNGVQYWGTVQDNMLKHFGFQIQFINEQVAIFQDHFLLELKEYEQSCEFCIRAAQKKDIDNIRSELQLGKTAYFCHGTRSRLPQPEGFDTKKNVQTSKSIGLEEDSTKAICIDLNSSYSHCDESSRGLRSAGSVPISKKKLEKCQLDAVLHEFDKLINSSNYKQQVAKTAEQGQADRIENKGNFHKQDAFPTVKNIKSLSFNVPSLGKKDIQQKQAISRSSTRKEHKYSSTLFLDRTNVFDSNQQKSPLASRAKCLKSERLKGQTGNLRQEKRVPSFVANREKAKKAKAQTGELDCLKDKQNVSCLREKKITFTYRNY